VGRARDAPKNAPRCNKKKMVRSTLRGCEAKPTDLKAVSHAHQSAMDFGVAEPVSPNTSRKGKNCAIAGLDSKEEQNLTVESCIAVSDGAIDADSRWFPRRWSADRKAAK